MGSKRHFFWQLVSRRISRRVAFWIFVSIVVIEAIILVPSARRQERELLRELEDRTSIKVTWLVANSLKSSDQSQPPTSQQAESLLDKLREVNNDDLMLSLRGAAIYNEQGQLLASFGDRPDLTWEDLQAGRTHYKNWPESLYDSSWSEFEQVNCSVILRHDISNIQTELLRYKLRIGALVVIISIFVTASTLGGGSIIT